MTHPRQMAHMTIRTSLYNSSTTHFLAMSACQCDCDLLAASAVSRPHHSSIPNIQGAATTNVKPTPVRIQLVQSHCAQLCALHIPLMIPFVLREGNLTSCGPSQRVC